LLVGDLLFVTTGNGVQAESEGELPSAKAPSFVAITKKDGKVKWQDNSPGDKIIEGQWSNPAAAQVNGKTQGDFGGGDGWLYGFEADSGKRLWRFNCNPKKPDKVSADKPRWNYIVATPVLAGGRAYVGIGVAPDSMIHNDVGHFWCVDLTKTGDVSAVNDNFDPKAAVNKDSALVWHFGGKVNPPPQGAGRRVVFGPTISNAVVHDGLAYVVEETGFVYCMDAKTGKLYWEEDLKPNGIWGSPYWVDNKVYIATTDGDVWIFAHGKEKK